MLNVKSSVFSDDEQINFAEREGKKAAALEPELSSGANCQSREYS